jgi:hypothetical protein
MLVLKRLVQRAHLENDWLCKRSNVRENRYIINSHLEGSDVIAYGAKIVHAKPGKNHQVLMSK